ncbi:MAG: RHS repeat-associated core domain-containing protein [Candidatus Obscuribacter sp.]|nr:RHS repeat-associated core domain-containing protein [Candidatus Obscuribacter sp.]
MWYPAAASTTYGTADSVNKYPAVGGTSYTYNANKNLTGDGVWAYGYNTENQLVTASKSGTSASFVYDPMQRQSQKTVGAVKTRYIYSEWQRIADYNGVTGTLQNRYVYGTEMDEPLIQVTSAGVLTFLHADKMGTVIAVSNAAGAVVNKNPYGQFGESTTIGGTTFGYTGQRRDAELDGLHYYKMRVYSPKIGRFLQPDPVGYAGASDFNLYSYVGNRSLKFTDPMGQAAVSFWFLIFLYIAWFLVFVALGTQALATDAGIRANPAAYKHEPLKVYDVLDLLRPLSGLPFYQEYYQNLAAVGVKSGDGWYPAGYIDGVAPAGWYTQEQIAARTPKPQNGQPSPSGGGNGTQGPNGAYAQPVLGLGADQSFGGNAYYDYNQRAIAQSYDPGFGPNTPGGFGGGVW